MRNHSYGHKLGLDVQVHANQSHFEMEGFALRLDRFETEEQARELGNGLFINAILSGTLHSGLTLTLLYSFL